MKKQLQTILVLSLALFQSIPSMAKEYLIKQEIYDHVRVPCLMAKAEGDAQKFDFMSKHPDVIKAGDKWADTIYVIVKHTSDADIRKRAYPLWRNVCMDISASSQGYFIKQEIHNNVIVPCTLQGATGSDMVLAEKYMTAGKEHIESMVQAIYNTVQYTESESVRMDGYPVYLNSCLALMRRQR